MNIGILTFYQVANFGANLQGISTYYYLKNKGHYPIFINYMSDFTVQEWNSQKENMPQAKAHESFVNSHIKEQTEICYNIGDLKNIIKDFSLDAIIIGSDAVLQHHPFLSRIKMGKRKPFYITHPRPESMYPSLFWGKNFANKIPTAMMSVSSQNSPYKLFSKKTIRDMKNSLIDLKYISVRDTWTKDMINHIIPEKKNVKVTPDPVFAFNYNAKEIIPTKEQTLKKFGINSDYVLISLHNQSLKYDVLKDLKDKFSERKISCIAFPMPKGINFNHPFDKSIETPLSPIDWYALIKYANAYIGSNMHPIIVCLHNAVPCYSIDHWGTTNFFHKKKHDGSSKVEHILKVFNLEGNRSDIEGNICNVDADTIIENLNKFSKEKVIEHSKIQYIKYNEMMNEMLKAIEL